MKNFALVLASIMFSKPVPVRDFIKGLAAYNAGDYATALQEWLPLAEQGNIKAQRHLAILYDLGKGVPQNFKEARKWYRLAAKQGDANAQCELGMIYSLGDGASKDYPRAIKWYRLAAEQGYSAAQHNLGISYKYGQGTQKSNVMAHMWYNIASANGHSKADEQRDELAGQMTNADISKAQQMARECMSSGYKNCGG